MHKEFCKQKLLINVQIKVIIDEINFIFECFLIFTH
jgi:hypothetical protein